MFHQYFTHAQNLTNYFKILYNNDYNNYEEVNVDIHNDGTLSYNNVA